MPNIQNKYNSKCCHKQCSDCPYNYKQEEIDPNIPQELQLSQETKAELDEEDFN